MTNLILLDLVGMPKAYRQLQGLIADAQYNVPIAIENLSIPELKKIQGFTCENCKSSFKRRNFIANIATKLTSDNHRHLLQGEIRIVCSYYSEAASLLENLLHIAGYTNTKMVSI